MSLILDALRKSDRQRTRQAAERLRDGPGTARPQTLPRWLLGGLLASVLLLAFALFLALQQGSSRAVDRSAAGAKNKIMENEPAPTVVVRSLSAELAQPPREEPGDKTAAALATEAAAPTVVVADAHASTSSVGIDDLNAMPLNALPVAVRARLPQMHVDIHAWSENPQERFVLINLQRYQEGDRLREGPVIRRILPDGVVLESDGLLFSLPRQ